SLSAAGRAITGWRWPSASGGAGLGRQAPTVTLKAIGPAAARATFMALLVASLTALPLQWLRSRQEGGVRRLLRAYGSADREPVPVVSPAADDRPLMTWRGLSGRVFGGGHYPVDYYVLNVMGDTEFAIGAIGFRYAATTPPYDLSETR